MSVRPENATAFSTPKYYEVPANGRDQARRVAFRVDRGRRETDFSEIMNNTTVPDVTTLDKAHVDLAEKMQ